MVGGGDVGGGLPLFLMPTPALDAFHGAPSPHGPLPLSLYPHVCACGSSHSHRPSLRVPLAGAGGIGSTAILLAKAFGARVLTTVSSRAKAEVVARCGADLAIDYTAESFPEAVLQHTQGKGADIILCFIGGDYVPKYAHAPGVRVCAARARVWAS